MVTIKKCGVVYGSLFFLGLLISASTAPERANRPPVARFAPYNRTGQSGQPPRAVGQGQPSGPSNPWQPRHNSGNRNAEGSGLQQQPAPAAPRASSRWGNNSRTITSAPTNRLPNPAPASTRFFNREQPPPRRSNFCTEQAREQQNQEARRTVAVNTWQAFLRERIVSLGYFAAGDVWLRSNTFHAGHFSQEDNDEQVEYARWCRDTILGFER